MLEFNYKPQGKDADHPSPFDGTVRLQMFPPKERIRRVREMKFAPQQQEDGVAMEANDNWAMAERIIDLVEKQVMAVALTHRASGQQFTSLLDVSIFQEGMELINELGNVLLSGPKLGNG